MIDLAHLVLPFGKRCVSWNSKGYLRQASNKRPVAEKPTIQKILKYTAENLKEILDDTGKAYLEQMRQFIEVGALNRYRKFLEVNLARIHKALVECHHSIGDRKLFQKQMLRFIERLSRSLTIPSC